MTKRIICAFFMAMLLFASCDDKSESVADSNSQGEENNNSNNPNNPEDVNNPSNSDVVNNFKDRDVDVKMKDALITGTVKSVSGAPISGVTVKSGQNSVQTDADGFFSFSSVGCVNNREIVSFEKNGFFKVTKSVSFQQQQSIVVVMQEKGSSPNSDSKKFDTREGATLTAGGMSVEIPQGVMVGSDGAPYSGEVNVDMLYLSPDNDNFAELMPGGDLSALNSENADVQLISYGMFDVNITDANGKNLQISQKTPSKVSFPVPQSVKNDPPAKMPLWHFSDNLGVWVEDGEAVLNGDHYEGTVSHFSWWNCDLPTNTAYLDVTVLDCQNEPIPGVAVSAEQYKFVTDSKGVASFKVPAEYALDVYVDSRDYYGYEGLQKLSVDPIPAGEKRSVTIGLPCQIRVRGNVFSSCESKPVKVLAYVQYDINGTQYNSVPVYSNDKGEFSIVIGSETTSGILNIVGSDVSQRKTVEFTTKGEDVDLGTIDFCGGGSGSGDAPSNNCEDIFKRSKYGFTTSAYSATMHPLWYFMEYYGLYEINAWDESILPECFPVQPDNLVIDDGLLAAHDVSTYYKCISIPQVQSLFGYTERSVYNHEFMDDYFVLYCTDFYGPYDVRENIIQQLKDRGFFMMKDGTDYESELDYNRTITLLDNAYSDDYYFALSSRYSDDGFWRYSLVCLPRQISLPSSFVGIPMPQGGWPANVFLYDQYEESGDPNYPIGDMDEGGDDRPITISPSKLWSFDHQYVYNFKEDQFAQYCSDLEKAGFALSESYDGEAYNELTQSWLPNLIKVYTKGNYIVQVFYNKATRILQMNAANHSGFTTIWEW